MPCQESEVKVGEEPCAQQNSLLRREQSPRTDGMVQWRKSEPGQVRKGSGWGLSEPPEDFLMWGTVGMGTQNSRVMRRAFL